MDKTAAPVYTDRIGEYTKEQQAITRQLSFISFLRLLLFLAFAWFLYTAFRERFHTNDLLYALLTIPWFLFFVFLASKRKARNRFLEQLIQINENELSIGRGNASFLDDGTSYSPQKGFTVDLSIFGKESLFHLLNRAGSKTGREQLSRRLCSPLLAPADIRDHQAGIRELSGKLAFRQNLLAHTLLLEEEEALPQLRSGIRENNFAVLTNRGWTFLATAWPITGLAVMAYAIWVGHIQWALAIIILGLLLLSFIFKKVSQLYNHISKRSYLYGGYAICFRLISDEKFEHAYLQKKQKEIAEAEYAFNRLARLSSLFDLRVSGISIFINGLFLFDLLCARAYLNWNKKYQPYIATWFDTMGEIEALNSLATFHYNHPAFIFPEPIENELFIRADGMGHPLMNQKIAVVNDIELGHPAKLHLITGSNMSGKSTFLRALGLNMILAQTGAPVFAKTFVFRPVQFLTSFHHIDSLSESTSYFYAELKALQAIIRSLNQPVPSLVLLDEVMRGTNSKDKHDGTALLIKKILGHSCLTVIATHDTELGILAGAHPGDIENFCFESALASGELTFDFKKRNGIAQTTNATYLMQQMGII